MTRTNSHNQIQKRVSTRPGQDVHLGRVKPTRHDLRRKVYNLADSAPVGFIDDEILPLDLLEEAFVAQHKGVSRQQNIK